MFGAQLTQSPTEAGARRHVALALPRGGVAHLPADPVKEFLGVAAVVELDGDVTVVTCSRDGFSHRMTPVLSVRAAPRSARVYSLASSWRCRSYWRHGR